MGLDTTFDPSLDDLGLDFSGLVSVVTTTRSITARESDMSIAQWSSTPFASSYSTDQTLPFTPVPLPVPAALAFAGLGWVVMRRSR
ncbi:MAG: hypothetical protein AAGI53_00220 [Planctomycetota bacterium]